MMRLKLLIVAICLGMFIGIAPVFSQMTKTQLQTMYTDFLKSEGYGPTIDADGDVRFKKEGRTYYIIIYENDQNYFNLLYPGFWEIESQSELAEAYRAASIASANTKVAKVWVTPDESDVSATAEILLNKPSDFESMFDRLMRMLKQAVDTFIEEM